MTKDEGPVFLTKAIHLLRYFSQKNQIFTWLQKLLWRKCKHVVNCFCYDVCLLFVGGSGVSGQVFGA